MEIYQLQAFLEVARCLSFTEAADALNLTQPAGSAKIKSLESELNTPLFHRLGRKVELTEVGEFLAEEGVKLVELEAKIRKKVEDFKQGNSGTLRIGASLAIADWLSQFIYEYRQRYPGVQTKLEVFESSEKFYKAITDREVDLGFSEVNFEHFSEILNHPVGETNYGLVVAKTHPLARQAWLSLKQLTHHPWVLLSDKFSSHLVFESRLSELGIKLADFKQIEIVNTLGLMRTYLTQGNYIGFASDLELQECNLGELAAISLQEFALKADIFLLLPKRYEKFLDLESKTTKKFKQQANPIQKFLSLLPSLYKKSSPKSSALDKETWANSQKTPKLQSPHFLLRGHSRQDAETISIKIGIQNGTIPTVTAGLIPQQLGLLEHFLPRIGYYSSANYSIQWCDFPLGKPIVEGLHNNELDIGVLGDYPLLQSAKTSENSGNTILVSFVAINPEGTGNAVVVPQQSQINSLEDLRGRKVALPFGSSAHGMVLRALKSSNLLADVELCSMNESISETMKSQKQSVAGYAHFSPFHELAHFQGKYRYLFQGNLSGLPGFYGVVVRQAFADKYPEIVIGYLQAMIAAQYWYNNTPTAISLISKWTKISSTILGRILNTSYQKDSLNLFFPDLEIRADWIQSHINQLQSIPSHQYLEKLQLNGWIQPEFLKTAVAM